MLYGESQLQTNKISKTNLILVVFGGLDALTFLLNMPRIFRTLSSIFFPASYPVFYLLSGLWLALNFSYVLSAYGFIKGKGWAFVLYYCQFPLRLSFCSGSLGFLYRINILLGSPAPYYIFGLAILLGEVIRLVATVVLHRRLRNQILVGSNQNEKGSC